MSFFRCRTTHLARRLSVSGAKHHVGLVLGLAANLTLICHSGSLAQEDNGKNKAATVAPMPPVRPTHWPASPAPAVTPKAPAAPSTQTVPNDPVATIFPDQGPMLPAASRSRMHQCGREWESMKESGAAADQTWRAFAQSCLIR